MKIEESHRERTIDAQLKEIGNRIIKGAPFTSWGQNGESYFANLSPYYKDFSETDYYYSGSYEFFHLTSFPKLFSILNERAIRFYDLHSSADENEYAYAANVLRISENEIYHAKTNVFTFSFSQFSAIKNPNLWKVYGDNFRGAAIVFELINDPNTWMNYHLSEIKYSVPESWKVYRDELTTFEKQYGIEADIDLVKLLGFHKKDEWVKEKEIRILAYKPFSGFDEKIKHLKFDYRQSTTRNRITNYFKLPLWVDNDSNTLKSLSSSRPELNRKQNLPPYFFDDKPKIKIKDILFGVNSGLSHQELTTMKSNLEELITYNYGYDISISDEFFQIE